MQTRPTTPFGRRSLSLAMVASQTATEEFAAKPGASETVVHKWRLFRALTEAKEPLGVTERALSVLHALLSFHQETALALAGNNARREEASGAAGGIVVFPSNKELSIRAHGMAPATLRRHLACLVDAGLIIRRDSPNGKRFARKGQGGAIEDAFGFDLAPLVARSSEIENLAEEMRAENRAIALLREKITLTRRDIAKMIETALEEGVSGDWDGAHERYATLSGRYGRRLSRADLEALAGELTALAAEIHKSLETHIKAQNMSGNESQTERHIQNQTTNSSDLEPSLRKGRADPSGPNLEKGRKPIEHGAETSSDRSRTVDPKPALRAYPLGMVLEACPDIVDYAPSGEIASWRDLAAAAAIVRSALGVSPDAWAQAVDVLGEHDASIVIAAILQRGEEIKSAGGYLRVLTEKARAGEFSLGPVLMALLRGKAAKAARERKKTG
ncbi:plasmid replication protein RepC [Methylosinus trichosporium]|uniref:Replication initiation protein RepC n=1 Tax=Methylosinus trichosporium (strain ATCC 35070 / NCIMB 11131 / UNIQEM 75 / OB3b) TaxID=595536 RepID=A0A2D2D6F9_METT3|nr:plasmid replication protein RepC [Methylosinus trichosporium]ATQ70544.1 replication initiation protein RepC [Methylosinus trichosporium OB3b]